LEAQSRESGMDYAQHMRSRLSFHQDFNIYSHLSFEEFQTVLEFVKNHDFQTGPAPPWGPENHEGPLLTDGSGAPEDTVYRNCQCDRYFFYTNNNMRFLEIYNQLVLLRSKVYNIFFTSRNTFGLAAPLGYHGQCHILYMKRQPYNYESDIRILVQGLKMQKKNTWEKLVECFHFYNKNQHNSNVPNVHRQFVLQ
jgi:hypothetical protein